MIIFYFKDYYDNYFLLFIIKRIHTFPMELDKSCCI